MSIHLCDHGSQMILGQNQTLLYIIGKLIYISGYNLLAVLKSLLALTWETYSQKRGLDSY